jgi:hypothetical protein
VYREVEQQLRAKRKEARLAVLSRADADAAAAAAGTTTDSSAAAAAAAAAADREVAQQQQQGPPLPRHSEARHPGAVPGARVEHVMELWNFLQVCTVVLLLVVLLDVMLLVEVLLAVLAAP